MNNLPATMRAITLKSYDQGLDGVALDEIPMPQPKRGEVLIKVAASPINPADLMFVQGLYGFRKKLPCVPGFEASGVVVAAGDGIVPRLWMGRRVACTATEKSGTWAEYMIAPALQTFPIPKGVSLESGSMMFVNPFTAYALLNMARRKRSGEVVQTAAGGALGQMIWRLAGRYGITMINIVRRAEQRDALRAMGMQHVLASSDPNFDAALKEVCRELKPKVAFDAVGGDITERVARALVRGGQVIVYGGLALQNPSIGVDQLIFRGKSLTGFWLTDWLPRLGLVRQLNAMRAVRSLIASELHSDIRVRYSLPQVRDALHDYSAQMSGGKVLFVPHGDS